MNPTSGQNFEQFVKDAIAEQLAQSGSTTGTPTPEPLSLNVGGQTFQYASKAELEASLNNFVGAAGQKLQEMQSAIEQAQAPTAQQGSYVTGSEPTPQWDDSEFVKKMTESPQEGLKYAFNQMFFDGKSQDPVADIRESLSGTELTKRGMAAYQFKENHPEFPGGQQFANKIDEIRQNMGLPYDYNGIEAAYLVGIQRGALPNFYQAQAAAQMQAQAQQQAQYQQQGQDQGYNPYAQQGPMNPRAFNGGFGINGNLQNNPYTAAPPGVSRTSPFDGGTGYNPEDLSIEQIEAIFNKAGRPIPGAKF